MLHWRITCSSRGTINTKLIMNKSLYDIPANLLIILSLAFLLLNFTLAEKSKQNFLSLAVARRQQWSWYLRRENWYIRVVICEFSCFQKFKTILTLSKTVINTYYYLNIQKNNMSLYWFKLVWFFACIAYRLRVRKRTSWTYS